MTEEFDQLVKKYKSSPEFRFVNLSDPNQRGMTGDTLLHAAAVRGDRDDIEVLIRCGADINAVGDLGNTALHYAASRGFVEVLKTLLAHGARRDSKNEFGQTPLDVAKINKRASAIRALQDSG